MSGLKNLKILIRGAGDIATGVAHRLYMAGFRKMLMLELETPLSVRREVSFSEAIYEGRKSVEGVEAVRIEGIGEVEDVWRTGRIPVMVDPELRALEVIKPHVLVDATLSKKNTGIRKNMADLVIGLGPGFTAGVDVDIVVETKRGHNLGRVIRSGSAEPNTGIPGRVMGYAEERVLRAPEDGLFKAVKKIGDVVEKGDTVGFVEKSPVISKIGGVVRGLIRSGIPVKKGLKIGDVDPRCVIEYCYTISDKARAVGGGVLEAILEHFME